MSGVKYDKVILNKSVFKIVQVYSYVTSPRRDLISAKVQKNADITLPDVRSCQQKTTKESTQSDTCTVFTSFSVHLVTRISKRRLVAIVHEFHCEPECQCHRCKVNKPHVAHSSVLNCRVTVEHQVIEYFPQDICQVAHAHLDSILETWPHAVSRFGWCEHLMLQIPKQVSTRRGVTQTLRIERKQHVGKNNVRQDNSWNICGDK